MTGKEAQSLIDAIKKLVDQGEPVEIIEGPKGERLVKRQSLVDRQTDRAPGGEPAAAPDDFEALYRRIKVRLLDECAVDPILLHLLTTRPELIVGVEPRTLEVNGDSLRGRIGRLMVAGFFREGRKQNQVRTELMRTGSEPNSGGLSTAMNDFVKDGFLVRDNDLYALAPGVKVSERILEAR